MIPFAASVYLLGNVVVFILLMCMVYSAFEKSERLFRIAVGFLAMMALAAAFFGLETLTQPGLRDLEELGEVAFVEVVKTVLLALVLLLMRLRQIAAGQNLHSKQRRDCDATQRLVRG